MTTTRDCCVCEGQEKRVLYRQPLVVPESGCSYGGYEIVACHRCGFVFADHTYSQQVSDAHYAEQTKVAQELSKSGEPPGEIIRLDHTAAVIRRFLNPRDRVLDVGCGTARLLSLLKEAGFEHVQGLDQSPVAAEIARTKYGIHVAEGSVFDYRGCGFDAVLICHVLEHIVDLASFLRRIFSLLSESGLLYIEVPDAHQFDRFVDPSVSSDWIYLRDLFTHFTPEHVNFFSPVSLRNLMRRFGFEEVCCESDPIGVVVSVWKPRTFQADSRASSVLLRYAAESQEVQQSALETIELLASSGEELLIWGAGLHTQRLLATGNLGKLKIRAFVDSDPAYRRSRLAGKPIIASDEISSVPGCPPILVSSWKAQSQILRVIESMKLPNRAIPLYPASAEKGT